MVFLLLSVAAILISSACGYESPKIYDNLTTKIVVNNGDPAKLECYATGSPTPKITWMRTTFHGDMRSETFPNGDKVYEGSVVEFPAINQSYRGIYVCQAGDSGDYITKEYTIEVRSAPEIKNSRRIDDYDTNKIQLHCSALANPANLFVWFKNGEQLTDFKKYVIAPGIYDSNIDVMSTYIEIPLDNADFYGTYKCLIENELGKSQYVFDPIESSTSSSNV